MGAIWNGFVSILELALKFLYDLTGSAGLAVILFTVAVKIILFPLTVSQLRSSREMQKLQPKINELRKKYGKDQQKLQQETMNLYKEHGVNPTQGCLPSLLQLPIFFGVYYAVLNLTRTPSVGTLLGRWLGFSNLAALHLGSIPSAATLMQGVTKGIMAAAPFLWMQTLGKPDPWHILPILAGALQIIQQKMMTPKNADPQQAQMNNAMMLMPLMIVFIGWNFAAGPVIYWVAQSLVSIVQQYFITGWGSLTDWLPFLPDRAPEPPKAKKPRPQPEGSASLMTEERPRPQGWFMKMMERASAMQQQVAEQERLKEAEEPAAPENPPPALPPTPEKRRSRR